ncbi:MAG: hypothetical protein COC02_07955 [Rhodospirillaceae bacterium]|jgi:hypothetical protein|nr:MAG: hypothetical protein COC02_07955 [Rhodospirillaceae bacterium]
MSMTTAPYRREDIDDEGFQEPLMVRNMACCAKEIWDLRGSLDMVDQYSDYYLREMPKVEQTSYEENESGHNRMGAIEMSVRAQWDRVVERLGNARDWCYMPELPENPQFLTGDSPNPSFYTIAEINSSNETLKELMDNAFNRGVARGKC